MKILLINNQTQHLQKLNAALGGHDVEMQIYQPGLDFHYQDKDLVILSGGGGEGLEIDDQHISGRLWYEDQMEFVLRANKPVLGICMGFEVICRAYGETVNQMPKLLEGRFGINTTKVGRQKIGRKELSQFESHQWRVTSVSSKQFDVLATSETGLEMIRHRQKPIFATQFHPEGGGSLHLSELVKTAANLQ